jgi:methyltransferase
VTSALLLAMIVFPMLIEAWRAARNERAQRASGGIEPPGDVYPIMQVAYPGAFLAMLAEGAARGGAPPSAVAIGATLFSLAKAVKWWAILTLGQAWTFRVIVVPEAPLVTSGPYRFMRHPNYAGVVGELVGVALMTGAWIAGPITTLGFLSLILKRIQIETRALCRPER